MRHEWTFALALAFAMGCHAHQSGSTMTTGVPPTSTLASSEATNRFWSLVDSSGSADDPIGRVEILRDRLATMEPAEIMEFQRELDLRMGESYSRSLWGAAYLIAGGCSDDGFEYFRGWLIAHGREVFEQALRDPDSLASLESGLPELEEMLDVAREAYEESVGEEMPDIDSPGYPSLEFDGVDFEDEEAMRARYPRIYAKHIGD